jgi:hypothetical protein
LLQNAYEKEIELANIIIETCAIQKSQIILKEIGVINKFNTYYETYLMSCEDLLAIKTINDATQVFDNSDIIWKRKILHALDIEKQDTEKRLKNVQDEIQQIVHTMISE